MVSRELIVSFIFYLLLFMDTLCGSLLGGVLLLLFTNNISVIESSD